MITMEKIEEVASQRPDAGDYPLTNGILGHGTDIPMPVSKLKSIRDNDHNDKLSHAPEMVNGDLNHKPSQVQSSLGQNGDSVNGEELETVDGSLSDYSASAELVSSLNTNEASPWHRTNGACSPEELSSEAILRDRLKCHKMDLSLSLPSRNCVIREEDENKTEADCKHKVVIKDKLPPPKESLLLRRLESKLLDASIAITHLYKSKEPGVQSYIGKCNFMIFNHG